MPAVAGYVHPAGTINRDNGMFPFTISKTVTGTYNVLFNNVAGTHNYTVGLSLRNSKGGMTTYSTQTTGGFFLYVFNSSGVSADIGFSFTVFWS